MHIHDRAVKELGPSLKRLPPRDARRSEHRPYPHHVLARPRMHDCPAVQAATTYNRTSKPETRNRYPFLAPHHQVAGRTWLRRRGSSPGGRQKIMGPPSDRTPGFLQRAACISSHGGEDNAFWRRCPARHRALPGAGRPCSAVLARSICSGVASTMRSRSEVGNRSTESRPWD